MHAFAVRPPAQYALRAIAPYTLNRNARPGLPGRALNSGSRASDHISLYEPSFFQT